jgi:hypothetical protein
MKKRLPKNFCTNGNSLDNKVKAEVTTTSSNGEKLQNSRRNKRSCSKLK